jgi:toxin CptA
MQNRHAIVHPELRTGSGLLFRVGSAMRGTRAIPLLRLHLGRSRLLLLALIAAHLAAAAAVLFAVPAVWSAAGLALLAVIAARSIRCHALRMGPRAVHALELEGESACRLRRADGSEVVSRVQGSSYVLPWLVVLHLRVEGRRRAHYVVLVPDCVPAQSLRPLRVRLRWMSTAQEGQPQQDPRL